MNVSVTPEPPEPGSVYVEMMAPEFTHDEDARREFIAEQRAIAAPWGYTGRVAFRRGEHWTDGAVLLIIEQPR